MPCCHKAFHIVIVGALQMHDDNDDDDDDDDDAQKNVYTVFQKGCHQTHGVTLSNLNRFALQNYFSFQWWKNFENRLRFDEVTSMSLAAPFFGTQCISGRGQIRQNTVVPQGREFRQCLGFPRIIGSICDVYRPIAGQCTLECKILAPHN